jgi:hypothetical protein
MTMNAPAMPEAILDMGPLVEATQSLVRTWESSPRHVRRVTHSDLSPRALASTLGLRPKKSRQPEIVLATNLAVELGPPDLASRALILTTERQELVCRGLVTVVGPDLQDVPAPSRLPFAQVIMLALAPGARPDPFALENAQYLMHRLPGYMARSIPGRLWIRVSSDAHRAGLTLWNVGAALIGSYLEDFPEVVAAEVLYVTSDSDHVSALGPVALEAEVVAGKHRKLAISKDGELECADLSCETCEERPVCDGLRDMWKHRGRSR